MAKRSKSFMPTGKGPRTQAPAGQPKLPQTSQPGKVKAPTGGKSPGLVRNVITPSGNSVHPPGQPATSQPKMGGSTQPKSGKPFGGKQAPPFPAGGKRKKKAY